MYVHNVFAVVARLGKNTRGHTFSSKSVISLYLEAMEYFHWNFFDSHSNCVRIVQHCPNMNISKSASDCDAVRHENKSNSIPSTWHPANSFSCSSHFFLFVCSSRNTPNLPIYIEVHKCQGAASRCNAFNRFVCAHTQQLIV